MAGSNVVIKEGTVLFKEGDEANGMFLVRKGELEVFLERDGNIVSLAKVGPGGMIGEMAFFDKQPRSASVRTATDCEITVISNADFTKLMKQIPKWFVSIMSSLSTRLRETNARLQEVEEKQKGVKKRWQMLSQILHVLSLLWHKDGIKEGKDICLSKKVAETEICTIFDISRQDAQKYMKSLIEQKVFGTKIDQYNNSTMTIANRAIIEKLIKFIEQHTKSFPDISCFSETTMNILEILLRLSKESVYDSASISFATITETAAESGKDVTDWHKEITTLEKIKGPFKMNKMSSEDASFRADPKELEDFLSHHQILTSLQGAGLDR